MHDTALHYSDTGCGSGPRGAAHAPGILCQPGTRQLPVFGGSRADNIDSKTLLPIDLLEHNRRFAKPLSKEAS